MANSHVRGATLAWGQQQWFARDSAFDGGWWGGSYNQVFIGVTGALGGTGERCDAVAGTSLTADAPGKPVVEKPYITIDDDGRYFLVRPAPRFRSNASSTYCTSGGVDPYSTGVHVDCCSGSTEARIGDEWRTKTREWFWTRDSLR